MTRRLLIDECVNRRIVLPPFLSLIECVFLVRVDFERMRVRRFPDAAQP